MRIRERARRVGGFGRALARTALVASFLLVGSPAVLAGPTGEQVVRGDVQIHRDGSLTAISASDGSIINFDSFDILRHETVQFQQPSVTSRVLNRVLNGDPTRIDGSLLANGKVYIANPAGVFFGGSAVVDVAGLIAAAGELGADDFLAQVDHFTNVTGAVENVGTIHADVVGLVGRTVANHGSIATDRGMVALVAGDDVFLASSDGRLIIHVEGPASATTGVGIENSGEIDAEIGSIDLTTGDAYSLAINHTGILRGRDVELNGGEQGRVEVAGEIDTSNLVAGARGGSVRLLGEEVILSDARIDASGEAGGGEIRIGGDLRGGADLLAAKRTRVDAATEIAADAIGTGEGGLVVVWSDERTDFEGEIQARGGEAAGNGGFVEVSSKGQLSYRGRVDLRASRGRVGTLLLDPENLFIINGSGGSLDSQLADGTIFRTDGGTDETISEDALEAQSELSGIVLEATNDIVVEDLADDELSLTNSISFSADADSSGSGVFRMDDAANDGIRTVGGDVLIAGTDITVGAIDTSGSASDGESSTNGGSAGAIVLTSRIQGDIQALGPLTAKGGASAAKPGGMESEDDPTYDGGLGGSVFAETAAGTVAIHSIDTSGGAGDEIGGAAGQITLTAAEVPSVADSDPDDGVDDSVPAMPGTVTVSNGITQRGGTGGEEDGGDNFVSVTAEGAVDLTLTDIASLTILQRDATSDVDVQQGGLAVVDINGEAGLDDAPGSNVVQTIDTATAAPGLELNYALSDENASIEIPTAAVTIGGDLDIATDGDLILGDGSATTISVAGGSSLGLRADAENDGTGSLLAPGDVTHIATDGDLTLQGVGIGEAQTFQISAIGGEGVLSMTAQGRVDVDVAGEGFGAISVTQRDAAGDIDVLQSIGTVIDINGSPADPEAEDPDAAFGVSTVVDVDTTAGEVGLVYSLEDGSAPVVIETGSMRLGGDSIVRSGDDLTVGTTGGTAIEMVNGSSLLLAADADASGAGALMFGDPDVVIDMGGSAAQPAQLLLFGGEGIGSSEAPIRTRGSVILAGVSGEGDFQFVHDGPGLLRLGEVLIPDPTLPEIENSSIGVFVIGEGSMSLENTAGPILFAGVENEALVQTGGAQTYRSAVEIESTSLLIAGTQILFERSVDTAPFAEELPELSITAFESAEFRQAVGGTRALGELAISEVGTTRILGGSVTSEGTQTYGNPVEFVGATEFRATDAFDMEGGLARSGAVEFGSTLDGADALLVLADSGVLFGGDVGTSTRPAALIVETPGGIEFGASQVLVGMGGIELDPVGRIFVPEVATLFKRSGSLSFDTPGNFRIGRREKFSVGGDLEIRAVDVTVGDIAAEGLYIDSSSLTFLGREPGLVLQPDGSTLMDQGVDYVADRISLTARPVADDGAADYPDPTFATQDGALSVPGEPTPFAIRLFDSHGGSVSGTLAAGGPAPDGEGVGPMLDLVGTGPRATLDPATQIPRPPPETWMPTIVASAEVPRAWQIAELEADEVYAFLRCSPDGHGASDDCSAARTEDDAERTGSTALDTPRARTIARDYQALTADPARRSAGLADLHEAIRAYHGAVDSGASYSTISDFLEHSPKYHVAFDYLASIDSLLTELRLLDLGERVFLSVREKIVSDLLGSEPIEGITPVDLIRDPLSELVASSR